MKKKWLAVLSLSVALVASGCSSDDDATSNAGGGENVPVPTFPEGSMMKQIQDRGTLKVGVKFDQPGFGVKNLEGDVEGFDAEIAKRIAQGIFGGTVESVEPKIEFIEAISRNREPYIQNGTVDMVVATYTINDTRKRSIDFAGPYYIAGGDLLVKQDNNSINSVTDLAGKNACTAKGSTYPATLRTQVPTVNLLEVDTYSLCVEALKDGRVEAVATDNIILAGFNGLNPGEFKLVGAFYTTEPYGIGVPKNADAFRTFINERLQTLYDNGSWKAAYDSTFGQIGGAAPAPPAIDRYNSDGSAPVTVTTAAPAATTTTAAGSGGSGGSATSSTTTTTASTTTTR